ncbi:MAG: DUF4932 domain-containing protein [Bacteroidales bacterium]|nr:DUF4932 domain-containing protein [Bacteroidales bacterium]
MQINLIINMLNGPNNYSSTLTKNDGSIERYSIIGTFLKDSLGMPRYSNEYAEVVIHEYNHSFCNPLIDKHYEELKNSALKMFRVVLKTIKKYNYRSEKSMLYETLVRANVIRYAYSNWGEEKAKHLMCKDMFKGFIIIDEVVDLLSIYENNREKYPILDSFMPEITNLFDSLNYEKIKTEYENNCGNIIKTSFDNFKRKVSTNTEIIIYFDKPMDINTEKCKTYIKSENTQKIMYNKITWAKTNKSECTINIDLEPNTEYKLMFSGFFFMTENYFPLSKNYELDFKTK